MRCTTWAIRSARSTHIRKTLKTDGTLMLVEPKAGDSLAENLNPVGRVYYAFSTSVCVPASLNQEVGTPRRSAPRPARSGLPKSSGAAASRAFRRAAETPFNMVLEARP